MSTLIKVTYFGKNRPTIINTDKVESMYQMIDVVSQTICTRIQFSKENYILVNETPQQIMKDEWSIKNGKPIDMSFDSPTIEDLLEQSYNQQQINQRQSRPVYQEKPYRKRIYNTEDSFNRY